MAPDTALGSGAHRWWVQTWNAGGYGPWSSGLVFSIGALDATATATATLPATATASATPTVTLTPTATPTDTATASPTPATFVFANAAFVYDGDGKRVKSTINGTETTYFAGTHYEVTDGVVTKYYYAGTQRIAMRTGTVLSYLLSDHLGSTSLTTDASGNVVSELRYKAWGEVRYSSGSTPTAYQYTGQYSYASDFGLLFYNARWYDPSLGRFAQADSIIPDAGNPQAWDRYAYVTNNPLTYTDPTGHKECDLDCQIRYEVVDPIRIHYGEGYGGNCWGYEQCLGIEPGTIVANALEGDTGAIVDTIVPTTFGLRAQGEFVAKKPLSIFGLEIPWSISAGIQTVFNRKDGDLSVSLDITPEVGPAFMPDPLPFGASATGGPLLGWFSSDAQQLTTGESYVLSGTVAAGDAYSAAIIRPAGTQPDPEYGVTPVTIFVGTGYGGGYLSGGGGISTTLWEYSANIYDLFR